MQTVKNRLTELKEEDVETTLFKSVKDNKNFNEFLYSVKYAVKYNQHFKTEVFDYMGVMAKSERILNKVTNTYFIFDNHNYPLITKPKDKYAFSIMQKEDYDNIPNLKGKDINKIITTRFYYNYDRLMNYIASIMWTTEIAVTKKEPKVIK